MDYTVLLDAPGTPAGRIQIARLGDFKDKRYGDFSITTANVANWQKNLSKLPGGEVLVDFEHRSERAPRDSKAAGWLSDIQVDGDVVTASARWTPDGEKAIKDGTYRFFSPAYGPFRDEQGTVYEDTLVSGALTNKPALTQMRAVTLASSERVSEALSDEIERLRELHADLAPPSTADSRRSMTPDALKLLGLDENADDTLILEALTTLTEKAQSAPVAPEQTKTLEQQAADAGKKLLDTATLTQLVADAAAGRQAADALKAEKFDRAFTTALDAGQAIPAQREQYAKFYELDADGTLEMLAGAPKLVNVAPAAAAKELTADNIDDLPAERQLAARIELAQRDDGLSYQDAYLKVLDQMGGAR